MLKNYRAVFAVPGNGAFCTAAFVMRMSIAIYPLALVLLVSLEHGEYGFGGLLSGAYILGGAIGQPVLARVADGRGQNRVILPATAVHVGAFAILCVLAKSDVPRWLMLVPAFVGGFAYLSVGSLVRARWSYVLQGRPEATTAYALESTLDEVIFVTGPLLATVVATAIDPVLTVVVAATLVGAGALWLAGLRDSAPPPHPRGDEVHPAVLREPGMPLLIGACAGMGALFASAELSMIAFCGQRGEEGASGLVLASMALGSGVSGFVYGARSHTAPLLDRFLRQALVFAALPLAFVAAANIPLVAAAAFVMGLGIAPALIGAFGLIEQLVRPAALTEGLAWLSSAINVGFGIAAPLTGWVADEYGARAGFLVAAASAAIVGVLGVALSRRRSVAKWTYSDHRG